MMRILFIASLVMLLSASLRSDQTQDENWKKCRGDDRAQTIEGCSAIINSRQKAGINLAQAFYDRGGAFFHQGDYDHAIQDYDEALRLNPSLTNALYDRGLAFAQKRDYDHAIQDYGRALRLNPSLTNAYYGRGIAYAHKGDYDHAIQDYGEALRLNPSFANAYYSRGIAYAHKSDYGLPFTTTTRCCGWIRALPIRSSCGVWHAPATETTTVPFKTSVRRSG